MKNISLLSANDTFIEINGIRVAAIKSYKISSKQNLYDINSHLKLTTLHSIPIKTSFLINLSKVSILSDSLSFDFSSLSNFNLVIVKPNCRLVFCGCNWTFISETATIDQPTMQLLTLSATKQFIYNLPSQI